MIPPFKSHPLVLEFNGLKKYFRKHQSNESRSRLMEFRKYSQVIKQVGHNVAFDFVGSMNFGQSVQNSDVDLILYIECETYHYDCIESGCKLYAKIRDHLLKSLVQEYANHPYQIEIIDCLNLKVLMDDLILENVESDTLIRFAFYRSIGRSINSSLLRPYQDRLTQNHALLESLHPHVDLIFDILAKNYKHTMSMKKYQERLQEDGIRISPAIRSRLQKHLNAGLNQTEKTDDIRHAKKIEDVYSFSNEENQLLDAANAKFLSSPDTNHEFSKFPQLALFQIRGNFFSVHENKDYKKDDSNNLNECIFLIHSERNRQKLMCHLMMTSWIFDLTEFVELLLLFENKLASDEDEWQAESFSIECHKDCYRLGSSASGQTPQFIARDLLILFTIQICDTAIQHPKLASNYGIDFTKVASNLFQLNKKSKDI